jgi:hypothetical protein
MRVKDFLRRKGGGRDGYSAESGNRLRAASKRAAVKQVEAVFPGDRMD